jgi:hypothetical protein
MEKETHDEPSAVRAEDGAVQLECPSGVFVSLTPLAAMRTGESLIQAGVQAQVQAQVRPPPSR